MGVSGGYRTELRLFRPFELARQFSACSEKRSCLLGYFDHSYQVKTMADLEMIRGEADFFFLSFFLLLSSQK
jgi:hypothetical protein